MGAIAGTIKKVDAELIMIFRVGDKFYPATEINKQSFEAYLHTNDPKYLDNLEDEVQL